MSISGPFTCAIVAFGGSAVTCDGIAEHGNRPERAMFAALVDPQWIISGFAMIRVRWYANRRLQNYHTVCSVAMTLIEQNLPFAIND